MKPRGWWIDAVIVLLAFALRIAWIEMKPPHFDEGVNGWFVDQMTRTGYFHYDPGNFHGPLHFYALFVSLTLFGREVWALRLPVVIVSTLCVALWLSRHRNAIALGIAEHSALGLTNTTSRQILFRVSRPQFKCDGVWAEFRPPAEFIWQGTGQPLLPIPAAPLPAGTSSTVTIARPMNITAPLHATAWRVGVVWTYASPTRFENVADKAVEFITGRLPRLDRESYTNFSAEVLL